MWRETGFNWALAQHFHGLFFPQHDRRHRHGVLHEAKRYFYVTMDPKRIAPRTFFLDSSLDVLIPLFVQIRRTGRWIGLLNIFRVSWKERVSSDAVSAHIILRRNQLFKKGRDICLVM